MKHLQFLLTVLVMSVTFLLPHQAHAQVQSFSFKDNTFPYQVNIGKGVVSATNANAYLEIGPGNSATKGILMPRGNKFDIQNPTQGLTIFDIPTQKFWVWANGQWQIVGNDITGPELARDAVQAMIKNTASIKWVHDDFGDSSIAQVDTPFVRSLFHASGTALSYDPGTGTFTLSNAGPSSITLNTSGVLYNTPINFVNTAGAWSGTLNLATQSAYTVFGNHTSGSATPTMGKLPVQSINATGSTYDGTKVSLDNGTWGNRAQSFTELDPYSILNRATPVQTANFNISGTGISGKLLTGATSLIQSTDIFNAVGASYMTNLRIGYGAAQVGWDFSVNGPAKIGAFNYNTDLIATGTGSLSLRGRTFVDSVMQLGHMTTDPITRSANGQIYYNTTSNKFRVYINGAWTDLAAGVQVNKFLNFATPYTPTSTSDATGNVGDVCRDENYIYQKTSSGWKRSAIFSTF